MPKISICVSLDKGLVSTIDQIAENEDLTRSWIVEKVMTGWLENWPFHMRLAERRVLEAQADTKAAAGEASRESDGPLRP